MNIPSALCQPEMFWPDPDPLGRNRGTGVRGKTSAADGFTTVIRVDGRYYRDLEGGSMLGPVQKAWLKKTLTGSTATFKVLASPVPFSPNKFESSRLTNRHTHPVVKTKGLVWSYNKTCSFGLMHFDTTRDDPEVRFELVGIDGTTNGEHTLRRSELRPKCPPGAAILPARPPHPERGCPHPPDRDLGED